MQIKPGITLDFIANLVLSETEARALNAITEYGIDSFLKAFYECMGKEALTPYEKGLRSLFECVREELRPMLQDMNKARETLKKPVVP